MGGRAARRGLGECRIGLGDRVARLRTLALPRAKSFLLYLHEGPTFHRINELALQEYLKRASDVVLLLDGLDEIFDEDQRKWALNDLQPFADEYRNVRIILTSRVIGYEKSQQRLTDLGFGHFLLQDLEDGQIEEFLERRTLGTVFDDARKALEALLRFDSPIFIGRGKPKRSGAIAYTRRQSRRC